MTQRCRFTSFSRQNSQKVNKNAERKKRGKFEIWYLILAVHVRFFREVLFNAKILSLVTQPFISKPVSARAS